jgi:hypothetical protein
MAAGSAGRWFFRVSPATWAAVLGGLLAVSTVAMLPLTLLSDQVFDGLTALVIGVPCAGVGVVVARRQPRNPIGWLFLVIAVCLILGTDGMDYALLAYRSGRHLPVGPVALVLDQLWGPGLQLLIVVILLFPDGRLPARFWRWALRAYWVVYTAGLAAHAVATAGALAGHPVRVDATGGLAAVDNPAGWYHAVRGPDTLVLVVFAVCFIGRQVVSWRRSSSDRRQQLKWMASGAASPLPARPSPLRSARRARRSWTWSPALPGSASRPCRLASGWGSCATGCMTSTGSSAAPWPTRSSPGCWSACTPDWCS